MKPAAMAAEVKRSGNGRGERPQFRHRPAACHQ
jgi:hypothetical protein